MKMIPKARQAADFMKKNGYGTIGTAATVYSGVAGYNDARNEGAGVVGAAAKGITDALIIDLIGWPAYLGIAGTMGAASIAKSAGKAAFEKSQQYNRLGTAQPFSTATHVDSEQSYTMRQAGLSQIQNNMFNTKKAVMGNEAMHMHR